MFFGNSLETSIDVRGKKNYFSVAVNLQATMQTKLYFILQVLISFNMFRETVMHLTRSEKAID